MCIMDDLIRGKCSYIKVTVAKDRSGMANTLFSLTIILFLVEFVGWWNSLFIDVFDSPFMTIFSIDCHLKEILLG